MDPTDRMVRLYQHLVDEMGEATNIIEYDETTASGPTHLPFVHIAIWDAKSDDDLTIYCSHFMANLTQYPFDYELKLDWWEHLVDPGKMPMFSGCKTLLLAPALSEIALKPFLLSGSEVKVLHIYPLTDQETHMVADHGREEFVEFIEERKIDLFSDRSD
jgi:hypothetical protein